MVGVQAKVPSSVSQPNSPPLQVRTLFEVQVARPAPLKLAVKRLEEEATVAKKLVEVALVEVELRAVKFWRVEDALVSMPLGIVRRPLEFIESADTDEVAVPATVVVAR